MFAGAWSTPSPSAVKPVVWECFRLFGAERESTHGCEECARARSGSRYARLLGGAVRAGAAGFSSSCCLDAISPRTILCQTKHYDFAELNNPDK